MWTLILRLFSVASTGYVLNDIGKLFGLGVSDDKRPPWWVWPLVISMAIATYVWFRKGRKK